jgi:hypothetical protein
MLITIAGGIIRAAAGCATEVRVAYGTYDPDVQRIRLLLYDGVWFMAGMRGSFNPNDRNPKRYATILSGSSDSDERNETIVTMGDGPCWMDLPSRMRGVWCLW